MCSFIWFTLLTKCFVLFTVNSPWYNGSSRWASFLTRWYEPFPMLVNPCFIFRSVFSIFPSLTFVGSASSFMNWFVLSNAKRFSVYLFYLIKLHLSFCLVSIECYFCCVRGCWLFSGTCKERTYFGATILIFLLKTSF